MYERVDREDLEMNDNPLIPGSGGANGVGRGMGQRLDSMANIKDLPNIPSFGKESPVNLSPNPSGPKWEPSGGQVKVGTVVTAGSAGTRSRLVSTGQFMNGVPVCRHARRILLAGPQVSFTERFVRTVHRTLGVGGGGASGGVGGGFRRPP
jgi:hypothetical protein